MSNPTTAKRDSQRSRVYDAEAELATVLSRGGTIEHFGSLLVVPGERKFGDVASVGPYLEAVLAFAPVAVLPRASLPVMVRERRGISQAHYEPATASRPAAIAIPPYRIGDRTEQGWALRESVVVHELAHHLAEPGEQHGPGFTAMHLYLLGHIVGEEAAHILRVAYYDRGVRIGPAPA